MKYPIWDDDEPLLINAMGQVIRGTKKDGTTVLAMDPALPGETLAESQLRSQKAQNALLQDEIDRLNRTIVRDLSAFQRLADNLKQAEKNATGNYYNPLLVQLLISSRYIAEESISPVA